MITAILINDERYNNSFDERYNLIQSNDYKPTSTIIIDASINNTTENLTKKTKSEYIRVLNESMIGSGIAQAITKVTTPYFAIAMPNCFYYRNKLSKSLQLIKQFDVVSCVYSDFDKSDKTTKQIDYVMEHPFDIRLFSSGYIPNINSLYSTKYIMMAKGINIPKLLENSIFLHSATPLFLEKNQ